MYVYIYIYTYTLALTFREVLCERGNSAPQLAPLAKIILRLLLIYIYIYIHISLSLSLHLCMYVFAPEVVPFGVSVLAVVANKVEPPILDKLTKRQ